MKNENDLGNVLDKVQNVDTVVNQLLVPVLQDTVKDSNKHNKRLVTLIFVQLFIILAISICALVLVYRQNIKYQEFLSQFEFGTEEYTYSQDLDTHEGGDIIDPSINVNQ